MLQQNCCSYTGLLPEVWLLVVVAVVAAVSAAVAVAGQAAGLSEEQTMQTFHKIQILWLELVVDTCITTLVMLVT